MVFVVQYPIDCKRGNPPEGGLPVVNLMFTAPKISDLLKGCLSKKLLQHASVGILAQYLLIE
jgi:hypothetical protein